MGLDYYKLVWENSKQSGSHKLTMLALAELTNDSTGVCWPSHETLAQMVGVSDRQIRNTLKSLEEAGEIEIITGRGRNHTNEYRITLENRKSTSDNTEKNIGNELPVSNEENRKSDAIIGSTLPIIDDKIGNPASENRKSTSYEPERTNTTTTTSASAAMTLPDEQIALPPSHRVGKKVKVIAIAKQPEECVKVPTEHQVYFEAICKTVGWDYKTLTKEQQGQVAQTLGILKKADYTLESLREFYKYWFTSDWRGKQGQYPTIPQLRAEIGKVKLQTSVHVNGQTAFSQDFQGSEA